MKKVQKNNIYFKRNIINVFTVTFDRFYATLLNKNINLFKKLIIRRLKQVCLLSI